jgi:hypothetical protein
MADRIISKGRVSYRHVRVMLRLYVYESVGSRHTAKLNHFMSNGLFLFIRFAGGDFIIVGASLSDIESGTRSVVLLDLFLFLAATEAFSR